MKDSKIEHLIEMVSDARICMFLTNEKDNQHPTGRPMAINQIDENGCIWFFSKESTHKIDEIEENNLVSLAIINESKNTYLMINGTCGLVHNKEKMKELWNPLMKAWFPEGLEDPDMVMIKVTPHEANYWDSSSSQIVQLFYMVKALVTGKESNPGTAGKIVL